MWVRVTTLPETNSLHLKMVVSNRNLGISFSRGLFSGATLVSGSVNGTDFCCGKSKCTCKFYGIFEGFPIYINNVIVWVGNVMIPVCIGVGKPMIFFEKISEQICWRDLI